jgi:hypothetical protein
MVSGWLQDLLRQLGTCSSIRPPIPGRRTSARVCQVRHAAAQAVVCSWQQGRSTTVEYESTRPVPLIGVGNQHERWIVHDRGHEIG